MKDNTKVYILLISVGSVLILGMLIFFFFLSHLYNESDWIMKIYSEHFAATIGLPLIAVSSTFVITIFKQQSKEVIKFEFLFMKFEGASGEITLWIFVYLAQAYTLHLVW